MSSNGYEKFGRYSDDGREFVITRPDTPRPWLNYAWSDHLLVSIDQCGGGHALYRDGDGHRSIACRDRFIYLKDIESGEFWTVGWGKIRLPFESYRCRHGLGYTVLSCRHLDWEAEWTISATPDSLEIWQVRIINRSGIRRKLAVYPGVAFALEGWTPYGTLENYARATIASPQMIYAENRSNERPGVRNNGFFAASLPADGRECSEQEFLGGYYESWSRPLGIAAAELGGHEAMNENMTGILQYNLELEPDGNWEVICSTGSCFNMEDARVCTSRDFRTALDAATGRTECFKRLDFELPEEDWTRFFNIWSKHQLLLLKDYARVFLIGFRDTLQDATSIVAYEPELAAQSILRTLGYQLKDGSALRGWSPIDNHKYADSGVWIAMAVAEYLRETGDYAFLDEKQQYFDGGSGTVRDHMARSLDWFAANLGGHNLPKLYFGDWNDSLNIGRGGRGESVWLAMALVVALEDAAAISDRTGHSSDYRKFAAYMREQIEKHAWDGNWYLRGFDDNGNPVGASANRYGRIFSEPQSWAVMAGLDPRRLRKTRDSVDKLLRTPNGLTVCTPPFGEYDPACGRISCMLPGWGENGSCYCHVTAFQSVADAMMRDGRAAVESLRSILPFHAGLPVEVSKLEPYAFSNMFRGPGNLRNGETFKGWTSGTVPWALRAMTHFILGIRPDFDGIMIDPVIPDAWRHLCFKRTFRNYVLDISIDNHASSGAGTAAEISVNGEIIPGNRIPVDGLRNGVNTIRCRIWNCEKIKPDPVLHVADQFCQSRG